MFSANFHAASQSANQRVFLSGTVNNTLRGGVLTLIRNQLEIKNIEHRTIQGHSVINLFKHNDKLWLIVNTYGHSCTDDQQSQETMSEISRQINDIQINFHPNYIVLAGDWNCVLNSSNTTTRV